jgi:hypothetical protein
MLHCDVRLTLGLEKSFDYGRLIVNSIVRTSLHICSSHICLLADRLIVVERPVISIPAIVMLANNESCR